MYRHSLSILAHDPYQQGLPTPPHSSFSTLAEIPYNPIDTYSPTPSTQVGTPNGEVHASKRLHLTPKTRRPQLPSTRPSTYSIDTLSAVSSGPTLPCHRCHRQPSRLADLAAFTTCEACGNSTCDVCIRQCEGQRCRRSVDRGEMQVGKRVCATCCVEVGVEGRVWCRTCYHNHDDDAEERGQSTIGKTGKEMQTQRVGMIAAWLDSCGD
jgi:hypothetical protein